MTVEGIEIEVKVSTYLQLLGIGCWITWIDLKYLDLIDRDRGSSRDRDRKRGRGPKDGLKCLKPLVKSCDLAEYCEDPDEDGSYR